MKIKINNHLFKKILAMFLIVLMIATTIPLNVFAASNMNLGERDNNSTIDVEKETHYGHELHYTPVGGTNYPAVYSFTTSSLGTNDVKNKLNISISPNPAKDFINIQSDGKIKSVEIYNLHGQKLITTTQKQINIFK